MKKNYTLKIVLAMLFVVLVSLVSFVGIYKGKNLLKDYSLGKDFTERKVATFSIVEETTEESAQTAEGEQVNQNVEQDKIKKYNQNKNIIEKRLASMKTDEYDIRLNEQNGNIIIEVPSYVDSSYFTEMVSKGKVQITNVSTSEVIVDTNGFKDASATIDKTTFTEPVVRIKIKLTKDAKNALKNASTKTTDNEGNESEVTFRLAIDGTKLYDDTATSFIKSAENGVIDLIMGQETQELEQVYEVALIRVAQIKNGELSSNYEQDSLQIVSSNINTKSIIIISIVIAIIMLAYAIFKFKKKGILSVISLVGLLASILLVLRYTNVKITIFTILGLAVILIANYILILKSLENEKTFKENITEILNVLIPCIIIAIVFCCAPYLQLATLGMTIFWGVIVMFIYNAIITRILLDK